jgi:hypothetical protein
MRSPSLYRARDALDLLQRDHEQVRKLLREFDRLRQAGAGGHEGKSDVVDRLCDLLSLCAQIEEELFYPAVRPVLHSSALTPTLLCDHALLRRLIARLDELEPADPGYDDAVADIGDCVLPSMEHAQTVLFAGVRSAGLDMAALHDQMVRHRRARQQQDLTRIGLPAPRTTTVIGAWPPSCRLTEM